MTSKNFDQGDSTIRLTANEKYLCVQNFDKKGRRHMVRYYYYVHIHQFDLDMMFECPEYADEMTDFVHSTPEYKASYNIGYKVRRIA
jgi:hypothetical protein